jgi:hypothetical protein
MRKNDLEIDEISAEHAVESYSLRNSNSVVFTCSTHAGIFNIKYNQSRLNKRGILKIQIKQDIFIKL